MITFLKAVNRLQHLHSWGTRNRYFSTTPSSTNGVLTQNELSSQIGDTDQTSDGSSQKASKAFNEQNTSPDSKELSEHAQRATWASAIIKNILHSFPST
jgi:hypothetical protein